MTPACDAARSHDGRVFRLGTGAGSMKLRGWGTSPLPPQRLRMDLMGLTQPCHAGVFGKVMNCTRRATSKAPANRPSGPSLQPHVETELVSSVLPQSQRRTVMMTPPLTNEGIAMSIRVQLRQVRFVTRQPYIELDGPAVRLRIPGIFGEVWNLNAADAVVVDRSPRTDDSGDDWAFEAPVTIPYAATTHPAFKPNLMLLFKTPQRIPKLRFYGAQAIGLSYRESQRAAGIRVDGLELRARNPQAAVETLAAAGLERVDRPNAWLRDNRRVTQDPSLGHLAKTTGPRRQRGAVSGGQVGADGMAVGGTVKRRIAALSLVVVALVAGSASWRSTQQIGNSYSPTPFTAADQSFSVTLPGKAKPETEVRPVAGIVVTGVTAHSKDGDVMISQASIAPEVNFDGQAGMRGSVDGVAKASGGTVSDYRLVPYGQYQGAVATIEGGRGVAKMMRIRLVYTGTDVIFLGCTGSVYDRTVASFHIA